MRFYDALQMDPSVLKGAIRRSEDRREQWSLRLALALRSALIVLFAIVLISLASRIFGSDNTPMAVVLFCVLLSVRFVDLDYHIGDSLAALAVTFILLLLAPVLAASLPPLAAAAVHCLALFAIFFLTCQRPEWGNGGLYNFAYIYLSGSTVTGEALVRRAWLTLAGYLICAVILFAKHRHKHRETRFHHVLGRSDRSDPAHLWRLRLSLGIGLALALGQALQVERAMWMGFACGSLLAAYPYSPSVAERSWQRLLGAAAGCGAFFLLYQLTPEALHPLMGPLGGFCLGFCTDYRFKTMFNCFGALMLAAGLYGVPGAVALRLWDTLLGVGFALAVSFLFHRLVAAGRLEQAAAAE